MQRYAFERHYSDVRASMEKDEVGDWVLFYELPAEFTQLADERNRFREALEAIQERSEYGSWARTVADRALVSWNSPNIKVNQPRYGAGGTEMLEKVWCSKCSWRGTLGQLLPAPNPFVVDEVIHGCPKCYSINTMTRLCDEPGCVREVEAGTSTHGGYRLTCHEHKPHHLPIAASISTEEKE